MIVGLVRRLVVGAAILLITLGLLEVASYLLFPRLTGGALDREAQSRARRARIQAIDEELGGGLRSGASYVIHPYLGYVGRPGARHSHFVVDRPFNAFGMLSLTEREYPSKRGPGRLVIGVVGGSVAEMFANAQEKILEEFLRREVPGFDREVVMVNLALGGFKQPQQLFQLEYSLLLGFEFDVVLNIDGFNDIAIAAANHDEGIQPVFPSGFHMGLLSQLRPGARIDPQTVSRLAAYYDTQRCERRVLALVEAPPLRHSAFFNLLASVWSLRSAARTSQIRLDAIQEAQSRLPPELRGPPRPWPADAHREAAHIWRESSLMLEAVCRRAGLPYVHVLQPNQYVEGSKPMGEEERRVALKEDHFWGKHAAAGYRYLRAEGMELRRHGVAFYDLTMLFRDRPEPLYADDCCHFGRMGNQILAERIARILERELGGRLTD